VSETTDIFGEPIHTYSMAEAIDDGTLVDVGAAASKLFAWPVLLTAAAWHDCVAWAPADSDRTGIRNQSETSRLTEVLVMTYRALRQVMRTGVQPASVEVVIQRVARGPRPQRSSGPVTEQVELNVVIASDDHGDPVLVVGFPDED
jgi:hypothetical protein